MAKPILTVLGVYRPVISAVRWKEQFHVTGDTAATLEHFKTLVLIEAIVRGLNEPFEMSKFGQPDPVRIDLPGWMQVGYDEGLLTPDGESLIERRLDCVSGMDPLRFAVYLHLYDPDRPLQWQGGEVSCPPVHDLPRRLMTLMPYRII